MDWTCSRSDAGTTPGGGWILRITIPTTGSRGDVEPYIALGAALRARGHDVCLATHADFESIIRGHGLEFQSLISSGQVLQASDTADRMEHAGSNGWTFLREFARLRRPLLNDLMHRCWEACRGADVILSTSSEFLLAEAVAEREHLPVVWTSTMPLAPSRLQPSCLFPLLPGWVPGLSAYNLLTHAFTGWGLWLLLGPALNRARRDVLGLPPVPPYGPISSFLAPRLCLDCYSAHVAHPTAGLESLSSCNGLLVPQRRPRLEAASGTGRFPRRWSASNLYWVRQHAQSRCCPRHGHRYQSVRSIRAARRAADRLGGPGVRTCDRTLVLCCCSAARLAISADRWSGSPWRSRHHCGRIAPESPHCWFRSWPISHSGDDECMPLVLARNRFRAASLAFGNWSTASAAWSPIKTCVAEPPNWADASARKMGSAERQTCWSCIFVAECAILRAQVAGWPCTHSRVNRVSPDQVRRLERVFRADMWKRGNPWQFRLLRYCPSISRAVPTSRLSTSHRWLSKPPPMNLRRCCRNCTPQKRAF